MSDAMVDAPESPRRQHAADDGETKQEVEQPDSASSSRSLSPRSLAMDGPFAAAGDRNGSSSHSQPTVPASAAAMGGALEEMNSTLRLDLESTRRDVAELRRATAARSAALAALAAEEDDEDRETARELALLHDLLQEELSPDEEDEEQAAAPTTEQRLQAAADRRQSAARAKTPSKGARGTTPNSAASQSRPRPVKSRISTSAGGSERAATAAASSAAAIASPWDSAAASASSSSSSSHPTHVRSREVVSQYRHKQQSVSEYEARQARDNLGEMEGTVKLKADLGDECAICLDGMMAQERVASLSCCHTFHAFCILEWLKRTTACPLCKGTVFHPLAALAQRQVREASEADGGGADAVAAAAASVEQLSSRMAAISTAAGLSPPSTAGSTRLHRSAASATAASMLDAESRARLRHLRRELQRADDGLADARDDAVRSRPSAASRGSGTAAQRAASAAAKVQAAVAAHSSPFSLTQQLQSSSAHLDGGDAGSGAGSSSRSSSRSSSGVGSGRAPRSASGVRTPSAARSGGALEPLSRTQTSIPRISSADAHGRSAAPRVQSAGGAASSSSSTTAPTTRPSSNSSSIRAAAAASLSLTPSISRTGKLATGSTIANRATK